MSTTYPGTPAYVTIPAYASVPGGETYTFSEGKWTFTPVSGVLIIEAGAASDPNEEAEAPAPDEVLGSEEAEAEEAEETGDEAGEEAEPE